VSLKPVDEMKCPPVLFLAKVQKAAKENPMDVEFDFQ
jgi:hypothetical protein